MGRLSRLIVFVIPCICTGGVLRAAPALSVQDLVLDAGTGGVVIVDGQLQGESTFGVTVIVRLIARPGARGQVRFTAAPPIDIFQLGDAWPAAGTFSPYDTDITGSPVLNGCDDDNGTFVPTSTNFNGSLARFPVEASANAAGTWDAVLTSPIGDSGWVGLTTTLVAGTVTVPGVTDVPTLGEVGLMIFAALILLFGGALIRRRRFLPTPPFADHPVVGARS